MNYVSYELNNGIGARFGVNPDQVMRRNPDPDRVERNHRKEERTVENRKLIRQRTSLKP
jgi:hypothetical protein